MKKILDFRKRSYSDVSGRLLGNANQGYFYANSWFCTRLFSAYLPAGDSNLRHFFLLMVSNSLKTPEDDSGSPNLASATKDQKISANPMPQGLS